MFLQRTQHYMCLKGHCSRQAERTWKGAEWELLWEGDRWNMACGETSQACVGKGAGERGADTGEGNAEKGR